MHCDSDTFIDGSLGNECQYVNSSCKPNCIYYAYTFPDNTIRVYLVANKDIKANTILYARYNWNSDSDKCKCQLTEACKEGRANM